MCMCECVSVCVLLYIQCHLVACCGVSVRSGRLLWSMGKQLWGTGEHGLSESPLFTLSPTCPIFPIVHAKTL